MAAETLGVSQVSFFLFFFSSLVAAPLLHEARRRGDWRRGASQQAADGLPALTTALRSDRPL